eukprot:GGOE01047566.1.p1 GENE.GGOE01047566.1~~GGOE01047566.1.p1  ORF type:complete len:306 (+),score=86.14 GGOE01047566.1:35-952(+)
MFARGSSAVARSRPLPLMQMRFVATAPKPHTMPTWAPLSPTSGSSRPTMALLVQAVLWRSEHDGFQPEYLITAARQAAFMKQSSIAEWQKLVPRVKRLADIILSSVPTFTGREVCRMAEVLTLWKVQHQRDLPLPVLDAIFRMMDALYTQAAQPEVVLSLTRKQGMQLLRSMHLIGLAHPLLSTELRQRLPAEAYVQHLGAAELAAEAVAMAVEGPADYQLVDAIGDRAALEMCARLRPKATADLLWAFAKLHRRHYAFLDAVANRIAGGFGAEFSPEEASKAREALISLGSDHHAALQALQRSN